LEEFKKAKINFIWSKEFNKRILKDYLERCGEQMNDHTKEAYAAHAVSFVNYIDKKINKVMKEKLILR
jgi:hypothetical protein